MAALGMVALALLLWAVRQGAGLGRLPGKPGLVGRGALRRAGGCPPDGRPRDGGPPGHSGAGELVAVATLGLLSGLIRRPVAGRDGPTSKVSESRLGQSGSVARAIEQVGFASSLAVAGLIGAAASRPVLTAGWVEGAEIGALLAVALSTCCSPSDGRRSGWSTRRRRA